MTVPDMESTVAWLAKPTACSAAVIATLPTEFFATMPAVETDAALGPDTVGVTCHGGDGVRVNTISGRFAMIIP